MKQEACKDCAQENFLRLKPFISFKSKRHFTDSTCAGTNNLPKQALRDETPLDKKPISGKAYPVAKMVVVVHLSVMLSLMARKACRQATVKPLALQSTPQAECSADPSLFADPKPTQPPSRSSKLLSKRRFKPRATPFLGLWSTASLYGFSCSWWELSKP